MTEGGSTPAPDLTPNRNVIMCASVFGLLVLLWAAVYLVARRARLAISRANLTKGSRFGGVLHGKVQFMHLMLGYTFVSLLTWGFLLGSFAPELDTFDSGALTLVSFICYNISFNGFFMAKSLLVLNFMCASSENLTEGRWSAAQARLVGIVVTLAVLVVSVASQIPALIYLKRSSFVDVPTEDAVSGYEFWQNFYFIVLSSLSTLMAFALGVSALRVYRSFLLYADISSGEPLTTEASEFVRGLGTITIACLFSFLTRGGSALGFAFQVNTAQNYISRTILENRAFMWFEPLNVLLADVLPTSAIAFVLYRQVKQGVAMTLRQESVGSGALLTSFN